MRRKIAALIVVSLIAVPAVSGAASLDAKKQAARDAATEITAMRSERAAKMVKSGVEITPEVFKSTCGAVGVRAKEIAAKNGFIIRHAATKNRNPANAATPVERVLIEGFGRTSRPEPIEGFVDIDGRKHFQYMAPIMVERACLACHGEKDARPEFIIKKYPEDKAYGFKEGDLRGLVSVSFPVE